MPRFCHYLRRHSQPTPPAAFAKVNPGHSTEVESSIIWFTNLSVILCGKPDARCTDECGLNQQLFVWYLRVVLFAGDFVFTEDSRPSKG